MTCPTCSAPTPAGAKQCPKCGVNFVGWAKPEGVPVPPKSDGTGSLLLGLIVILFLGGLGYAAHSLGWLTPVGQGGQAGRGGGLPGLPNSKKFLGKATHVAEEATAHTQELINELEKSGELRPGEIGTEQAKAEGAASDNIADKAKAVQALSNSRTKIMDDQLSAAEGKSN